MSDDGPKENVSKVEVDVRGLVCPEPVVRTRKALESAGDRLVDVTTDSPESRDNIARFAERAGYTVSKNERRPGVWVVRIRGTGVAHCPASKPGITLVVSSDQLGRGDEKLGRLLMTLFLRTLTEVQSRPGCLLLVNSGVKLALDGSEQLASLQVLESKGVAVRVCGTCLDYYGVKDRVRTGTVSNMYELVELLGAGERVISF